MSHHEESKFSPSETSGDDVPVTVPRFTAHNSPAATVMVPAHQGGISSSLTPESDFEHIMEICWDKQKVRLMDTLGVPLSRTLEVQCPFPRHSLDKISKDQRPVKALISMTYKRKINSHDGVDTDKENIKTTPSQGHNAPIIKHICWEKSGTEWQSVFDVIKYGEEQERKCTVMPVMEEKSR
ncbi:hypothetical protein EDD22DRAFT_853750 [Suillus occidentalis]|nr:hypothetical protein EDD22DRAFT_853750 [Suillus occidentalis]